MIDFPSFHARSMSFAISIIITLCLGSIQCFQSVQDGESLKDEYDQWLLWSRIGDGCKGDENAWIKPAFIGYLVGQLLGGIFGVALYIVLIYHCILKNLKFPP
ncbi:Enhancer of translation termination [Dirofilaria immitis]